ncbi:hypothetical protein Pelo_16564 [Pelomyxa schiedti]|nr:hypothetical protein Pelo_16564 [Pelomyxa schiedti]
MPHQEYKAIYFGVSRILMSVTTPVTLHQTILGKPPCYNGTTGRWIGPNHYCTIDPVPAGIEFGIVDIRSDTREFAIPAPWISASNANPRWAVTCFKWLSGFQITIGKLKDMSIQESITLYHQVAEGPGGTIWGAHFDSFHPDEVIITWSDAFHLDRCSLIVVHLSKSFSGRSLSIVSSTKFLLGSHAGIIVYAVGRFVITNKVHCFALKTTFSGDLVHLVTEGTGTVQPIKSKVNHDLQVSALSPNCFCISTMTGTCAELWDCNNTQQPLRVIEFTTVYGPQYDYGMAVASSGFLFLCHHNQIRVVDALPGMCFISKTQKQKKKKHARKEESDLYASQRK